MGGESRLGDKGGVYHTLEQKNSHCLCIKAQKQVQRRLLTAVLSLISAPHWQHILHGGLSACHELIYRVTK